MANPEQLAVLRQGPAVWNEWRRRTQAAVDLSGADLAGTDLAGADLSCAQARRVDLSGADLQGANLSRTDFTDARLALANLEGANLHLACLDKADLRAASLKGVALEDASAREADFSQANLTGAVMACSDFSRADLTGACLCGANLIDANLENARVHGIVYDRHILSDLLKKAVHQPWVLWKRLDDLILDSTTRCHGVNPACYGSQRFKLFLQDQDYLEELLGHGGGRLMGLIWWIFADCGRSVWRWAGWSAAIALIFSFIYWLLGPTHFNSIKLSLNFLVTTYYSIVTFTTLGFGDITPQTDLAAAFVTVEVILGYVMLGGLITIFSQKLARRGG